MVESIAGNASFFILLVEDSELIQRAVQVILGGGGFEIAIASSGEQAVELPNAANGKCRALVTDINLGPNKIGGWEVAQHASGINSEFPVAYMTADAAEDWASKGVPNSIMLSKPFAAAQLVTAVSQLLNCGTLTT